MRRGRWPTGCPDSSDIQILISGSENVGWVETFLQFPLQGQRGGRHDARKERAPEFSDSMMMRQRSAGIQNLISSDIFQLKIDILWIVNTLEVETEVEIDADSGAVQLCHACRHKGFAGQVAPGILQVKTMLYVFA